MPALHLQALGRSVLDLLYPPRCGVCEREGSFLCTTCLAALPLADGARCDVCWLPLRGMGCPKPEQHPAALTCLRSAFRYEGDARRLVHAFKYRGHSALAADLARPMLATVLDHCLDASTVVAVPLTDAHQRTRGYNQARLLAREISRGLDLPLSEALRRRGRAVAQAKSDAEQRYLNVARAFEIARPSDVEGQRVLLVDDVATTGATLDACARVLLAAGAIEVSAVTFGRED